MRFGLMPGSKEKFYKFHVLVKVIIKGIFPCGYFVRGVYRLIERRIQ